MRTGPGFWNYPQFNPWARGVPGATPPFVPTQGMPPMGMPPMGMPQAPSAPQMKGPAWLQKFAGGMDKFMGGLAGGANPYLAPQEQAADAQRRKMAMIAALIQSSGPVPKNSQGLLAPFGAAIQAGQEAGDQFSADAIRQRLAAAQMIRGSTSDAKPPASIAEYNLYAEQEKAAGREPMSFAEFVQDISRRRVGAQYGSPTDVPGVGVVVPSRTQGTYDVISPESTVSGAEAARTAESTAATTESRINTEAQTQARLAYPRIEQQTTQALEQLRALRNHPGRLMATGASRMLQAQSIPGTSAYDFDTLRKQVSGSVFLEAYQALKGGGTITEVEGKKAEEAKARMDAAQSEEGFLKALDDYEAALTRGLELAAAAAQGAPLPPAPMNRPGQGVIDRSGNASGTVNWDDL